MEKHENVGDISPRQVFEKQLSVRDYCSYNPDTIPPDWELAKRHGPRGCVDLEKLSIKQMSNYAHAVDIRLYQMVLISKEAKSIRFNIHTEQLSFLGSGYPLYFAFIRSSIILLTICLLSAGQMSILSNNQANDCQVAQIINNGTLAHKTLYSDHESYLNFTLQQIDNICLRDFFTRFSLANARNHVLYADVMDFLGFNATIFMMIYLIYFRSIQRQIDINCDVQENTPSDYSILVYNIPIKKTSDLNNFDYKQELKHYFEEVLFPKSQGIIVTKINLSYDMKNITKMNEKKDELIKEKRKILSTLPIDDLQLSNIDQKILQYDEELKIFYLHSDENQDFAGVAFVSFLLEQHKRHVLEKGSRVSIFEQILNNLFGILFVEGRVLDYVDGNQIKVTQAPEPSDVNWDKLSQWNHNSTWRKFVGAIAGILIFALVNIMGFLIVHQQAQIMGAVYKGKIAKGQDIFSATFIIDESIAMALSIGNVLINSLVMDILVRYVVNFQAFPTYTLHNIKIAQQLALLMFLNSTLTSYLVITFYTKNIYSPGGLVYQLSYFQISNCILPPLLRYIDIEYRVKILQKSYYMNQGSKCLLTQDEANMYFIIGLLRSLCEYPTHAIETGLADIVMKLLVAFFFGPLIPMSYIFTILGLAIYYFTEKYTLLKCKTVKNKPSFELTSNMTQLLDYIPAIFSMANCIFKFQVMGYIPIISILGTILAIIYVFLPHDKIVGLLFSFNEDDEMVPHDEAHFQDDYDRSNPLTQRKSVERWIHQKQQSKQQNLQKQNQELTSTIESQKFILIKRNYQKLRKEIMKMENFIDQTKAHQLIRHQGVLKLVLVDK